jgi:hypothetical protein
MKRFNEQIELIVKRPSTILQSKSEQNSLGKSLKNAGIETEYISENQPFPAKSKFPTKSLKGGRTNIIIKTNAKDTEVNPWDMAHLSFDSMGKEKSYIEPNFTNEFIVNRKVDLPVSNISSKSFGSGKTNDDFDPDWKPNSNIIWHLGDDFSQLKTARESVADINYNVRIGHLDTGYSKTHFAIPDSIRKNPLQHNFVI